MFGPLSFYIITDRCGSRCISYVPGNNKNEMSGSGGPPPDRTGNRRNWIFSKRKCDVFVGKTIDKIKSSMQNYQNNTTKMLWKTNTILQGLFWIWCCLKLFKILDDKNLPIVFDTDRICSFSDASNNAAIRRTIFITNGLRTDE